MHNVLPKFNIQIIISKPETKSSADPVLAAEFHPTEKWSLITCGKSHLSFWNFEGACLNKKQGVFEKYDKPKYVLCLRFALFFVELFCLY